MDKDNKTSKVLIIILILVIIIVAFLIIRDKNNKKNKVINSNTSNIVSDNNYSNIDSNLNSNEEKSNELSNSNIQSNSNVQSNSNSQINSNSNSNKTSNSNKVSSSNKNNSNSNKSSNNNANSNKTSNSNSNSNSNGNKSNSNSNSNVKQITSISIPSYYQDMNLSYKDTFDIKDIVKLEPKFEDNELKSWLNKLTYSSSNDNILKVSSSGVVIAAWPGSATITVKTPNGLSATLRLNVKYPNPYKVELYNVGSGTTINNQNYWIELITLNDNGCLVTSSCTKTISLVVKIGQYNASTNAVTNAKNVALYTNGNKVIVPGTNNYLSATIVGNAIQIMYYDM